jgi:hypothetical protein
MAAFNKLLKVLYRQRRVALTLVLSVGVCLSAEAANIYRYKDDNGRTVFNSSVPPEFVKNGYDILNERGQVIETVPRAKTAQEIAEHETAQLALEQEEEVLRKQRDADSLLLRLYRDPDEILRKRDERLMQLDSQIEVLNVTLKNISEEFDKQTQLVENAKAKSLEPSPQVVDSLASKTAELERLNAQLTRLEDEKLNETANADRDMARLRILLQLPEPEVVPAASNDDASAAAETPAQ